MLDVDLSSASDEEATELLNIVESAHILQAESEPILNSGSDPTQDYDSLVYWAQGTTLIYGSCFGLLIIMLLTGLIVNHPGNCNLGLAANYELFLLVVTTGSFLILNRKIANEAAIEDIRRWYLISRSLIGILTILAIYGTYQLFWVDQACVNSTLYPFLMGVYIPELTIAGIEILILIGIFVRYLIGRLPKSHSLDRYSAVFQLEKLPEKYRAEFCSICLENFIDTPTAILRQINPCQHVYHQACIDEWLTLHDRHCPLCRASLREEYVLNSEYIPSNPEHIPELDAA